MTRAALYARVSSSEQKPGLQIDDLHAVARQRHWEVVYEGIDFGSGASSLLESRTKVIDLARHGELDVVAVWRLDRLGRSVRDLLEIAEVLRRSHVELVSLRDCIETGTPSGQLLFTVLGAIAQFERELIGERVRSGIAAARARGVAFGRPRVDVDVERAVDLMNEGASLRAAARELGVSARSLGRALGGLINEGASLRAAARDMRQKPPPEAPLDRPRKGNRPALRVVRGRE